MTKDIQFKKVITYSYEDLVADLSAATFEEPSGEAIQLAADILRARFAEVAPDWIAEALHEVQKQEAR
jgi:hypothetical protein